MKVQENLRYTIMNFLNNICIAPSFLPGQVTWPPQLHLNAFCPLPDWHVKKSSPVHSLFTQIFKFQYSLIQNIVTDLYAWSYQRSWQSVAPAKGSALWASWAQPINIFTSVWWHQKAHVSHNHFDKSQMCHRSICWPSFVEKKHDFARSYFTVYTRVLKILC